MQRQARVSARKSVDGARQLTFEYISSLSKSYRNSPTQYGHPGQSAPISRGAKNCDTKRAKQANNFIILARVGSQVLFYFARKAFWTDRCGKFICGTGSQGPGLILPFYCVCECAAASARCVARVISRFERGDKKPETGNQASWSRARARVFGALFY